MSDPAITASTALLLSLPYWYLWAALVPAIVWLSRRYRIRIDSWISGTVVHLIAATLIALTVLASDTFFNRLAGFWDTTTFGEAYAQGFILWFHLTILVYWMIVAAVHAADYHQESLEREVAAARLETQVAEARLRQLQMQLHPHFLFNALHTASSYVRDHRPREATDIIAELADLLRRSMDHGSSHEATLDEELAFVMQYLRIEQARLGERLNVKSEVPDEVRKARVPAMLLHILVENAIRHGIAPHDRSGSIEITARRQADSLQLRIRDDGPGFPTGDFVPEATQVGLRNTRERLDRMYGEQQTLHLSNDIRGGAVVTVTIPWHTESRLDE
jgi:signal transduction histidine kinase